ncbi:GM19532 [Drosophila sechellia]|uniref:GM19532 n=1 Tax=Drosophila sechellia TaxID=7238 RepID=B4IEM7_DROSE|nr:GM19532 [Drosophila sechellia]
MIQDSPQERRRTSRRRSQKHHRWKKTQPIRNTQCNSNNSNTTNQPTRTT